MMINRDTYLSSYRKIEGMVKLEEAFRKYISELEI